MPMLDLPAPLHAVAGTQTIHGKGSSIGRQGGDGGDQQGHASLRPARDAMKQQALTGRKPLHLAFHHSGVHT